MDCAHTTYGFAGCLAEAVGEGREGPRCVLHMPKGDVTWCLYPHVQERSEAQRAQFDSARADGVREGIERERARVLALIDEDRRDLRDARRPDEHRLLSALRHAVADGQEPKGERRG